MTDAEILGQIPKLSALVIGDICLDRWCTYDPATAEPSRETGIRRIGVTRTEVTPGAGGTIANNLAALGAGRVAVLGAVGDDGFGNELRRALAGRGISCDYLVASAAIQTFTYTKLINGSTGIEDQPRVDFINTDPLGPSTERRILELMQSSFESFDVILISDQAETAKGGVVTAAVRALLADLAPAYPDKLFLADSRTRIHLFRNVCIKPNRQEADQACEDAGLPDYGSLRAHTGAPWMMITHGSEGVLLLDSEGARWVRTRSVEHPVDICGAGDSFCAGSALAFAVTRSAARAAEFGNRVAGITILKKGTGTATGEEILGS